MTDTNIDFQIVNWPERNADILNLRKCCLGRFGLNSQDFSDEWDHQSSCLHILASDFDGNPLGSSRIVFGKIEEIPINRLTRLSQHQELNGKILCEASRLCIPHSGNAKAIKFGLWKIGFQEAIQREASMIILSTRLGGIRDYERMLFTNIGELGEYCHSRRGGKKHYSLVLDLINIRERFETYPAMHDYFFGSGPLP